MFKRSASIYQRHFGQPSSPFILRLQHNMKRALLFALIAAAFSLNVSSAHAWPIKPSDVVINNDIFQEWFGTELSWHYESMPKRSAVPKHRMPYAGYIYPDNQGGTANVLYKYDRAFNYGRGSASAFERGDIARTRESTGGGLFGARAHTPDWAGHCNGWTAAAIRHAEPTRTVKRNGVEFTPADIKGLLSELYVYSDVVMLGGQNKATINPGMFHVILTNWISRAKHPFGFDNTAGKEIWNYPVYAYASSGARRGRNRVEVKTNIGYVYMLDQPYHIAPKNHTKMLQLHYMLELNDDGEIIGGEYFRSSKRVDIAWVAKQPTQGGMAGNENGNPHLNAKTVLSLWRASVPEEVRSQWYNIDPTDEDKVVETNHPLENQGVITIGSRPVAPR